LNLFYQMTYLLIVLNKIKEILIDKQQNPVKSDFIIKKSTWSNDRNRNTAVKTKTVFPNFPMEEDNNSFLMMPYEIILSVIH
jgi:hypothetical protein